MEEQFKGFSFHVGTLGSYQCLQADYDQFQDLMRGIYAERRRNESNDTESWKEAIMEKVKILLAAAVPLREHAVRLQSLDCKWDSILQTVDQNLLFELFRDLFTEAHKETCNDIYVDPFKSMVILVDEPLEPSKQSAQKQLLLAVSVVSVLKEVILKLWDLLKLREFNIHLLFRPCLTAEFKVSMAEWNYSIVSLTKKLVGQHRWLGKFIEILSSRNSMWSACGIPELFKTYPPQPSVGLPLDSCQFELLHESSVGLCLLCSSELTPQSQLASCMDCGGRFHLTCLLAIWAGAPSRQCPDCRTGVRIVDYFRCLQCRINYVDELTAAIERQT